MPKINQEEYEVLKGLDDKWKWIARDKDNTLVMGAGKNERYLDGWFPPVNIGDSLVVDETNAVKDVSEYGNMFQFIQWKNEEPYNIAELIEEYEEYEFYDYVGWEYYKGEEAEMKDIEWLKEETNKILRDKVTDGINYYDYMALKSAVDELINQLDEPEVLSHEWIDENKEMYLINDISENAVPVYKLQNLLVPKQELPVIPKFVAEWIESRKNNYPFDVIGVYQRMNESFANEQTREVLSWIHETELNRDSFTRAWLDGYEVEEEQKYYVIDKEDNILLIRGYGGIEKADNLKKANSGGGALKLTEQEIKDYDPRYMTFAVKTEELEE